MNTVCHRNASAVLADTVGESVDLIYVDPPFGTGVTQVGREGMSYEDERDDRWAFMDFMSPLIKQMHRTLKPSGTMYLHLDWRRSHHARVFCDSVFGEHNFLN